MGVKGLPHGLPGSGDQRETLLIEVYDFWQGSIWLGLAIRAQMCFGVSLELARESPSAFLELLLNGDQ